MSVAPSSGAWPHAAEQKAQIVVTATRTNGSSMAAPWAEALATSSRPVVGVSQPGMRSLVTRLTALLALATALSVPACTRVPPSMSDLGPRAEAIPPVSLVESVPSGTVLGSEAIPDTAPTWISMIDGATRRLDISQFYVSPKPEGALEPVLEAIEAAARRGVTVRLLVDAMFADEYPEALERLGHLVEIRRWDVKSTLGGVQHAKYFVVDDREAYLGSANFDWRALDHIHELGVRIRLPRLARVLREQMDLDWAIASGAARRPARRGWPVVTAGANRYRLVSTPTSALSDPSAFALDHLVATIDGATLRIAVQLLSYDTTFRDGRSFTTLDAALRRAAARGVAVRLAVSHWQKRHPDAVQSLARVPGIEARFITIPAHEGGFIPFARTVHAKYMAVDARVGWVGSSNWDGDYFHHSRNVGLLAEGPTLARELERIFERVWSSPYAERVDPDATYEAPRVGP